MWRASRTVRILSSRRSPPGTDGGWRPGPSDQARAHGVHRFNKPTRRPAYLTRCKPFRLPAGQFSTTRSYISWATTKRGDQLRIRLVVALFGRPFLLHLSKRLSHVFHRIPNINA